MKYIETIRLQDNQTQNINYHIARMQKVSSATLPILSKINTIKQGRVKCRIIYDRDSIFSIKFLPYELPQIKSIKIIEDKDIDYGYKYYDRTHLHKLYNLKNEADDILICKDNYVTDSYFCNVVFRKDNKLYTPNTPLLAGTKRQFLIDKNIIIPTIITCNDISSYDGIYLINAMIDLEDDIFITNIQ